MAGRAAIRASDADRELAAERLRKAAGEGRLRTEELEQRLEIALAARTYGELEPLLKDLPGRRLVPATRPPTLALGRTALAATLAVTVAVAVTIAVLFIATGVFAGWLLWIVAGWFFWGRRRHAFGVRGGPYGGSLRGCGGWPATRSRRHWA